MACGKGLDKPRLLDAISEDIVSGCVGNSDSKTREHEVLKPVVQVSLATI